ncbi:ScyD/ScyE family protein [Spirosoma sp. KCTC 42546]|uniref:ScyD/ScyE family protein n=1 Tax=Spirosoma sp. KCTC 42546 TaxID=2520506 RepID=UPI00115C2326|nr:ScyD/ScyE family protein [Spirosoma sp. KCTC 42546]QDK81885.1 ScyD/ScyE family protein [Spirosoma sp. KCTC 42546]
MHYKRPLLSLFLAGSLLTGCQDHRIPSIVQPTMTTLATGLVGVIGVETDATGRVFVTEQGTGNNDGRVSEITPDGKVHPIITGLYSFTRPDNELDATDHLLAADGVLYILNAKGLYTFNISAYKTGDAPIPASSLTPENIQKFVIDYTFTEDTGESHLYNMTLGPDGALYFSDAAANAIIRRSKTGQLGVVTAVPGIANPNPAGPPPGPPFVQSVPTGITYDGKQFAISTLLGFPFPAGKALIYRMDLAGKISVFQQTFNSLVDLENDGSGNYLALEFAVFGPMGWTPKTGRLLRAKGTSSDVLLDKLNLPTDLKVVDSHTAYLTSLGDGTLYKITF